MDAHAHLISLGWQGDGHALDARPFSYKQKGHRGLAYDPKQVRSTGGNGLVKPLLVSQRKEKFGIGKKAHEPAAGNEWWLSGFEKALGNIGKSESERETTNVSGTATPESSSGYRGKHGGLYGFFVKGQVIGGTIEEEEEEEERRTAKKRKSTEMMGGVPDSSVKGSTSDSGRKIKRKEESADDFGHVAAFLAARDKDEKRRKKAVKADALEDFQQVGEFFDARSERKQRKNENQRTEGADLESEDTPLAVRSETKEERRERRRRRREEKERAAHVVKESDETSDDRTAREVVDEAAAKAARKAERRRRKEAEARSFQTA